MTHEPVFGAAHLHQQTHKFSHRYTKKRVCAYKSNPQGQFREAW